MHAGHWLKQPGNVLALASLLVAIMSAIYAWRSAVAAKRSAVTADKAYKLAEAQDARTRPKFTINLVNCYLHTSNGHQRLAAELRVSNPTDSDNAIAVAELVIAYQRRGGSEMVKRVSADQKPGGLRPADGPLLQVPGPVGMHQT